MLVLLCSEALSLKLPLWVLRLLGARPIRRWRL